MSEDAVAQRYAFKRPPPPPAIAQATQPAMVPPSLSAASARLAPPPSASASPLPSPAPSTLPAFSASHYTLDSAVIGSISYKPVKLAVKRARVDEATQTLPAPEPKRARLEVESDKASSAPPTPTPSVSDLSAGEAATTLPALLERALVVHERQRQNPLLKHIAHVKVDFSAAVCADFHMSASSSALFLSLRYHLLRPAYIEQRIAAYAPRTALSLLLIVVDAPEPWRALQQLNALALRARLTLIACASNREAARYLETYRAYAHKSADAIRARDAGTPYARYAECLTGLRALSSTDALTLARAFGSLGRVLSASTEQLVLCPGLGATKVRSITRAATQPLRLQSTAPAMEKEKPQQDKAEKEKSERDEERE